MVSLFGGRIALVTGAGGGIGQAISRILARDGARVVVTDINEKELRIQSSSLINPNDHLALHLNVSDSSSVKSVFQETKNHYGNYPVLLAQAAGITRDNFLKKLDEKQFTEVLDVNLKGTFLVQKELITHLEESGETGAVVNISSIVAKHGNMGQGNYAASKAGVEAFTKSTAKELGKNGIRVNCVLPGFIDTEMIKTVPENVMSMLLYVTPLKRMGKPEEVAEVVSFLLSDKSSFMTGACIEVTGGLSV
ncbi:Estradiol 17-beta-dehydrogenase 8 [Armadillidium nasatum]|uniref:(3R)-3-hydroxyacyl-CoA dehydrogenase n=1 Tax=Armadillidium nasatum TaxID=96803 RepID=A0A5N5T0Z5_9CRUS|nr:Estradiol 17-beta-dehydrogenase 8 [Armadillidium nasatum]